MHRIVTDLDQCGMVGEAVNKLLTYLAVVSRRLLRPLAILIQSSSSAGKTTLMDAVLKLTPAEDVLRLSNLSAQSLYYLDSRALCGKTLAISEDHGLAEAAYALKILQSEGALTNATVSRSSDGKIQTQVHRVEGPVQLLLTSTAGQVDEELVNRCLVLTVDESSQQTAMIQHIQRLQRTESSVTLRESQTRLQDLHRNAQRLLQPVKVYIPEAEKLEFESNRLRSRRDNDKFLTLIEAVALLHQYQRENFTDASGQVAIRATSSDIELAMRLMKQILPVALDDLPPQTRNCYGLLLQFVDRQCKLQQIERRHYRFTRRGLREALAWSDNQLRIHLQRLVDLEYLVVHRGKQGKTYQYSIGG